MHGARILFMHIVVKKNSYLFAIIILINTLLVRVIYIPKSDKRIYKISINVFMP